MSYYNVEQSLDCTMGLLNLIFGKKEASQQIVSSEPIRQDLPVKNNETLKADELDATSKFTERQVSQIIDCITKEESNYNAICYKDNLGEVDMGCLDPLFEDAARLIVVHQQGSTSLIQRKFVIGYNRAGRIMDQLEKAGIVGKAQGSKAREVLCIDTNDLDMRLSNLDVDDFSPQNVLSNMSYEELNSFKEAHSESIKDRIMYYELLIEENKQELMREAIEAEKQKIKEEMAQKKRARDIREAAMRELVEEGILDHDYIKKREPIPQDMQDAVWNRDGGKCVKCGSQENLEFDHIIPFSKGGSTTIRNLQILCKKCNLAKSNKIG